MKKDIDKNLGPGTNAILESISDGVFTVDSDWRITSFNRAAETITGIRRREAVGKLCSEVFRASMCESDCALRHTVKTGKPIINRPAFIVNADGRRIPISVSTAILRDERWKIVGGAETFRDLSLEEELRKELEGRFQIGDMVSRSAAMRRIFDLLPQIAPSDATVLIHGETGTGKELLARAIHNLSPRKGKPFVPVNCGALPDTLLESELFGYVKGAFTGAGKDKPGRFALAEGGTVFLDEIGDISPALQVRLLRVLQERTYEPLGDTQTRHADVRIIAATHRDLAALIRKGAFREDLFYRLNVVPLTIPPLRERREDIALLADHFLAVFREKNKKPLKAISGKALDLLVRYDWPGNVRELENCIERAVILARDEVIVPADLPPQIHQQPHDSADAALGLPYGISLDEMEKALILKTLDETGGNRTRTAEILGINRRTLQNKLKDYGING